MLNIPEDDLEVLLEGFGLSEGEAKSFMSQALDLLKMLKTIKEKVISTLIERLGVFLSKLGISDSAITAVIGMKLQYGVHLLRSGKDLKTVLQYFQDSIKDLHIPTSDLTAFVGQVFEIVKSGNVSIAAVESSGQQLQDIISMLKIFDANVEPEIEALVEGLLLDLIEISDDVMTAYHQLVGLMKTLGISKADVKFVADAMLGFFNSLDVTDVMALLSDVHGLLIEVGFPSCCIDDLTIYLLKVFT